MTKNTRVMTSVLALGVCAFSVMLSGCTSSSNSTLAAFRANPTPEVQTLAQSEDEVKNQMVRMHDTDMSNIWEDLARAMHLDQPSRGSRYIKPY